MNIIIKSCERMFRFCNTVSSGLLNFFVYCFFFVNNLGELECAVATSALSPARLAILPGCVLFF